MARLVRLDKTGPIKIDPATIPPGKSIWVCACGLSATFPICDGTHKAACVNEAPGTLYVYDKDRKTVVEQRPDT